KDVIAPIASPLADPADEDFDVTPLSAAVADGHMHVLVQSRPVAPDSHPLIQVLSASDNGVFGTVHTIAEKGWSSSPVAGPGTVAVAIGGTDGVTSVATSSDAGASFSALEPVAVTPGGEPNVAIGMAVRPSNRPIAKLSWSVPPRFVD